MRFLEPHPCDYIFDVNDFFYCPRLNFLVHLQLKIYHLLYITRHLSILLGFVSPYSKHYHICLFLSCYTSYSTPFYRCAFSHDICASLICTFLNLLRSKISRIAVPFLFVIFWSTLRLQMNDISQCLSLSTCLSWYP